MLVSRRKFNDLAAVATLRSTTGILFFNFIKLTQMARVTIAELTKEIQELKKANNTGKAILLSAEKRVRTLETVNLQLRKNIEEITPRKTPTIDLLFEGLDGSAKINFLKNKSDEAITTFQKEKFNYQGLANYYHKLLADLTASLTAVSQL